MNSIPPPIQCGALGELLVQIRLLQYGVQAAPPIKDSGNDLIAVKGESFRAIQVKTRKEEPFGLGLLPPLYHILALVWLVGDGDKVSLDGSRVFLIPKSIVESQVIRRFGDLDEFSISRELISRLFA
jgi:hypothetical protein